ncbi:MAG: Vi polysaccharide biosynthesis UDP-N-acetylglucosaminuronic acid C-4 epimerase TviC [Parasphingorhabdus sp.]
MNLTGNIGAKKWLITGAAGFIGSNLVEALLKLGQQVFGLDNFSTGYRHNLEEALLGVSQRNRNNFRFIEGDIRSLEDCMQACEGVDIVLHQAALGSVPRSINDPLTTHEVNVDGFVNILIAAKEHKVKRFVFASSSSVYGDDPSLPKHEDSTGIPLSPYAVSKKTNELYASTFQDHYKLETIGLRYFNVFGKRQDPKGAYAAVIPKWIQQILEGNQTIIYGDGETSRDFCYVNNVIQANIRAGLANSAATNNIFNIACGHTISLNELYLVITNELHRYYPELTTPEPLYVDFRKGDIRHSLANIDKAKALLNYNPEYHVVRGLEEAIQWYCEKHN